MDEDVVLAFVVVGADGEVSRFEVCDEGVDNARDTAVEHAGSEGYVLAVTAHSLARLQPEPQLEVEVDPDAENVDADSPHVLKPSAPGISPPA